MIEVVQPQMIRRSSMKNSVSGLAIDIISKVFFDRESASNFVRSVRFPRVRACAGELGRKNVYISLRINKRRFYVETNVFRFELIRYRKNLVYPSFVLTEIHPYSKEEKHNERSMFVRFPLSRTFLLDLATQRRKENLC